MVLVKIVTFQSLGTQLSVHDTCSWFHVIITGLGWDDGYWINLQDRKILSHVGAKSGVDIVFTTPRTFVFFKVWTFQVRRFQKAYLRSPLAFHSERSFLERKLDKQKT